MAGQPPTVNQLVDWVDAIASRGVNLNVREEEFIESMQTKIEQYGERAMFSEAQARWIEDIYTNRVG